MARSRPLTVTGILAASFLAQLAGHFLLKQYVPDAAVGGGISSLLIAIIFSYVLFVRRDIFGFILVVYICSHFSYGDSHGGVFNVTAFVVLAFYLAANRLSDGFPQRDNVMFILLGVFILWNVLGWAMNNPVPMLPMLLGIAAFFGYILMFYLASNVVITKERFRLFLIVTFFMVLYQFIVALNQRYDLVSWNTPFIGEYMELGKSIDYAARDAPTSGTLRHFELFGEYGILLVSLLVPLLSSSFTQKDLRFGINRIVVMIFICLSFPMITSNRAAAILSVMAITFYYLVLPTRIFTSIDRFGRQIRVIVVVGLLVPIVGTYIGLKQLEEDFATLSSKKITVASVISGESINRGSLTSAGLHRINQDSWWVGNGYGVPRSNRWAWFGVDPEKQVISFEDYHSLYLSLPMLYGWIGSLAFLAMIVITASRLLGVSLRYRNRKSFLIVLAVGFTMFFGIFLIDEYKISILRNPNYHMLFWIWLGLANSVIKTIRYEKFEQTITVLSPRQSGNKINIEGAPT